MIDQLDEPESTETEWTWAKVCSKLFSEFHILPSQSSRLKDRQLYEIVFVPKEDEEGEESAVSPLTDPQWQEKVWNDWRQSGVQEADLPEKWLSYLAEMQLEEV